MIGEDIPMHELWEAVNLGSSEWNTARDKQGWPSDDHFWLHKRALPDGRVLYLVPMLHGNLQLGISRSAEARDYTDQWCYQDMVAAWRNVLAWNGSGEPDGWYRHKPTGRRRPDGTPESEYIRP